MYLMKKERYEAPEMEIVTFDMADVITTSGPLCDVTTRVLYSENGCSDLWYTAYSRDCQPGYMVSTENGGCTTSLYVDGQDVCYEWDARYNTR